MYSKILDMPDDLPGDEIVSCSAFRGKILSSCDKNPVSDKIVGMSTTVEAVSPARALYGGGETVGCHHYPVDFSTVEVEKTLLIGIVTDSISCSIMVVSEKAISCCHQRLHNSTILPQISP
jgi:hypothetical protein